MLQDRKIEWLEGADWDLFERQYQEPYRINVAFFDWLGSKGVIQEGRQDTILYAGAGMGANLHLASLRFPRNSFIGIDLNPECVSKGNERLTKLDSNSCKIEEADIYNLPASYINSFKGVFSLATFSWLPEFETAADCIVQLNPEWIAATSLFYDGPVDATIKTSDYSRPIGDLPCTEKFYNVYSLPRVANFFKSRGYTEFVALPFDIDIDLAKPEHRGMGTYTETTDEGWRLQISGPVLMSWYFVLARKGWGA